jgi:hypothetical protein
MKNRFKNCLLAGLLFPLTACAHYYQGQSGYYPNAGSYGSGYGGWQRNYYGHAPSQNYQYYYGRNGNYPNYRQPYYPVATRWDHEGHESRHHNGGWNSHYGYNQGGHNDGDRNSWQQHRTAPSNYPQQEGGRDTNNRGDHQGRGNDGQGQYNHHRRDHDE